jgi:hypothetical protein
MEETDNRTRILVAIFLIALIIIAVQVSSPSLDQEMDRICGEYTGSTSTDVPLRCKDYLDKK